MSGYGDEGLGIQELLHRIAYDHTPCDTSAAFNSNAIASTGVSAVAPYSADPMYALNASDEVNFMIIDDKGGRFNGVNKPGLSEGQAASALRPGHCEISLHAIINHINER